MPASHRTTTDIIRSAEETLKTAEQGLEDLIKGPPERKLSGLRNLIVFGRAVTNILQNLRSIESDFDAWYERYRIPEDLTRFGPPPPNAKGFFIGDNLGGSGWEVKLPDGSIEKYM